MRRSLTRAVIGFFFFVFLFCGSVLGQQATVRQQNMLNAGVKNYTAFTLPDATGREEAVANNPGYETHPEVGLLFPGTPCDNCYELIGKRTEISKTYVKSGTNGRDVMQQTASGAMHYKDANGEWLTIKSQLRPDAKMPGTFAAYEQEVPVVISPAERFSSLGKGDKLFRYNNHLQLVFHPKAGGEVVVGDADYSHYTAGDDGVYITSAWPGIDIEMFVVRGAIKTNFLIRHALPEYKNGTLVIRDHLEMASGWKIRTESGSNYGNLEVVNGNGGRVYAISAAAVFQRKKPAKALGFVPYAINGSELGIEVPGSMFNGPGVSYPVVVDPLVTVATSSSVNGSTYSSGWTVGCSYNNPATVPAKTTITDVQFTFQYVTGGGAVLNNGAYDFKLGACRSPSVSSLYWNCNSLLSGTCDALLATIYSQVSPCLPAPSCSSYDLNLQMNFYQNYAATAPCMPTYIMAGTPLTVTVSGHTVEAGTIAASASSICLGQSTVLSASAIYGVSPYSYVWSPGGATGATTTVSPVTTTTYTLTAIDACGNVSAATKTISVNTVSPITGTTNICVGGSSALTSSPTGGTWTSTNPSVASVGSSSGIVTGAGLGSATISYTTTAGCSTGVPVSVIAAVAPITGFPMVCQGSTTSLSDATPGGTWSSGNTSVAVVGSATGFASGISGGTANISYATSGAGCYATTVLTVNPLAAITGTLTICVGGSTTLSNTVTGGAWSSSSTLVTVGSASGVVTGIASGTASITYTTPAGCIATTSVVVNFLSPITGTLNVCQGSTTTLGDAASGGTWTSGNTSVATVGSSSGIVTGVAAGTVLISYSIPGGCFTSANVTVNPIGPVSGSPGVCVGGTTTLSDIGGAGTWTSSNTGVATIGSSSGILTGVAVGSSVISYTSSFGCTAATTVNITLPSPTTGITSFCEGTSTTLSNSTTGGLWTSSNTAIAIAGSSSGVVVGVSGGTANITYTNPSGCAVVTPVTVNPDPPLTGGAYICVGATTTLFSSAGAGSWSSGATGIATVDGAGVVTGVAPGMVAITFTTSAGCVASVIVTVSIPAAISGPSSVCQGANITLVNPVTGGTWTSSNTAVAIVGSSSGVVSGVSGGMATISYTASPGCVATMPVSVNPVSAITGIAVVCAGSATSLSDATPGGSWTSSNTAVAVVGSSTGAATGVAAGVVTILYTTTAGCVAAYTITVNAMPGAISGTGLVCGTTTFTDPVSGGIWTSSTPAVVSVGSTSGVVTPVSGGTATITYSLPGGCFVVKAVTVDPLGSISGTPAVCQGSTTALSYPQPGGTWSSLSTGIATVDGSTGVVSGIAPGVTTISYITAAGCVAGVSFTVNPVAPVVGATAVCQGSTTSLSNATPGGFWTSSNILVATVGSVSGVVTGLAVGTSTITYFTPAGCFSTATVTVNPFALTTGVSSVCAGGSTTLSNIVPGGSWSSGNSSIAGVGSSSGTVTGVSAGVTTIDYTTPAGCIASFTFTVHPLPSAIGGVTAVCVLGNTTLTNTLSGGSWSVVNPSIATIGGSTGVVSGVSADTVTVVYTSSFGCVSTTIITVNPLPLSITGTLSVCAGGSTTLSDATPGGTWSSGTTTVATIGSLSGVTAGIAAGTSTITYRLTTGCYTTAVYTVNPMPAAITGVPAFCEGATTTLFNTLPGGSWSSASTSVATVGSSSGVVSGVAAGTAIITYTSSAGCYVTKLVTVHPRPVITGITSTDPTTCITDDGTITLLGLTPFAMYNVTYLQGSTLLSGVITANASGQVVITGLTAGTYSNFAVTSALACLSATWPGPVILSFPSAPPAPVAGSNSPLCDGDELDLTATDAMTGVIYSWTGPASFASTLQNPVINPAGLLATGTYSVTATKLGCVSAVATTSVIVHPIPQISNITYTNPLTCQGAEGTVTLYGLAPAVTYTVTYTRNGAPASAVVVADGSGDVVITGLTAGIYAGFMVNSFSCLSNTAGPVTLADPNPPATPKIKTNSPICTGRQLTMDVTNAGTGWVYNWTGPNGYISHDPAPRIDSITMADSGLYSLTVRYLNCPNSAATNVVVYPPVVLTDVTPSQTIGFGAHITLRASGAEFYLWSPNDGSLSLVNIDTPIATPQQTTLYMLEGFNRYGCVDTAEITITVDYDILEGVPNAFTPNNDGKNDVFKIANGKYDKLVEFTIYNRWGQKVYENRYDISKGWDGTFNGVKQDMDTYNYNIIVTDPTGKTKHYKGTVILVR